MARLVVTPAALEQITTLQKKIKTRVQTLTLAGERFVILPEAEYLRLSGESAEPELPPLDAAGSIP